MNAPMRVARVWRYPVKSMLGQPAGHIEVTQNGVNGDRRYAIRTAGGGLGSGKNSGRLRRVDGLLRFRTRYEDERAILTFPDGSDRDADDPDISAMLSDTLGQSVTLEREDDGSHVDASPLHLLTTASLDWIARTLPRAKIDERRFRPNLVIETAGDEPVEQQWIDHVLRIGNEVVLRVTEPTERCGMVSLEQEDLPRDPGVLRHITQNAGLMFGVYAEVIAPGRIEPGDGVILEPPT